MMDTLSIVDTVRTVQIFNFFQGVDTEI